MDPANQRASLAHTPIHTPIHTPSLLHNHPTTTLRQMTSKESSTSAPDIDILPPNLQIHPPLVPEQQLPSPNSSEESRNLITANFAHFRDDPFSFLREISLHYSGTGWRAYDEPIGQNIFYKGFSDEMKTRVLDSTMLKAKLQELASRRVVVEDRIGLLNEEKGRQKRLQEVEKQLNEVAEEIVEGMICKFESKRFIRVCYPSSIGVITKLN